MLKRAIKPAFRRHTGFCARISPAPDSPEFCQRARFPCIAVLRNKGVSASKARDSRLGRPQMELDNSGYFPYKMNRYSFSICHQPSPGENEVSPGSLFYARRRSRASHAALPAPDAIPKEVRGREARTPL